MLMLNPNAVESRLTTVKIAIKKKKRFVLCEKSHRMGSLFSKYIFSRPYKYHDLNDSGLIVGFNYGARQIA